MKSLPLVLRRLAAIAVFAGLVSLSSGIRPAEAVPGFCPLDKVCAGYCFDMCGGSGNPCFDNCLIPGCCLR